MTGTASKRILEYIREKKLVVGNQLPGEMEIARELELSRNSVREAYVALSAKGVIRRIHGIGTFVASPILNVTRETVGFWGLIKDAGMTPTLEEISRDKVAPSDDVSTLLEIKRGVKVSRLRWLYRANGAPCILVDHYLPRQIPVNIFDVSRRDVLSDLQEYLTIEGSALTMRTSAVKATQEVATLLNIGVQEAMIRDLANIQSGVGETVIVSVVWMTPGLLSRQLTVPLSSQHFTPIE